MYDDDVDDIKIHIHVHIFKLLPIVISFAQGDTKFYDLKKYLNMSET